MIDRCSNCFNPIEENYKVCPYCGYRLENVKESPINVLPAGTILNEKYFIGRTLGEGGFGITYLAWDIHMKVRIAIKEFYPGNMIARDVTSDKGCSVYTLSDGHETSFQVGLQRYVNEAAILAKFSNLTGIVTVKDFFYENATAYIVMEYVDGISIKNYLEQNNAHISWEETLRIMQPVLYSMSIIHHNKLLHRDISPDNIMLGKNGSVKLIDFGAARYFDSDTEKSKTVMLKHGYAPIEQYSRKGDQGVWTDIYSLCATMYKMITGVTPEDAPDRVKEDRLIPIKSIDKTVPKHIAEAIEKGLSVEKENRYKSISELYNDLYKSDAEVQEERVNKIYQKLNKILIGVLIFLVVIVIGIFAAVLNKNRIDSFSQKVSRVFSEEEEEPVMERFENSENNTENEEDTENREDEKDTDSAGKKDAADDAEHSEEPQEQIQETMQEAEESESAAAPSISKIQPPVETEDKYDHAITVAENGRLTGHDSMTVGEILDAYSDNDGIWSTYEDENMQMYVHYVGSKNGESFVFEFQIFSDDTFKLTGAMVNNEPIEKYSDLFLSVLNAVGV